MTPMSSTDRPPRGRSSGNSPSSERREPSPARAAAFARFADGRTADAARRSLALYRFARRDGRRGADPARADAEPTSRRRGAGSPAASGWRRGRSSSCLTDAMSPSFRDRLPDGVVVAEGAVAAMPVDDAMAALNEALSPPGCTISRCARR